MKHNLKTIEKQLSISKENATLEIALFAQELQQLKLTAIAREERTGEEHHKETIVTRYGFIDKKTGERWTPYVHIDIDKLLGENQQ